MAPFRGQKETGSQERKTVRAQRCAGRLGRGYSDQDRSLHSELESLTLAHLRRDSLIAGSILESKRSK